MEFRILGPLEVRAGGRAVPLPGAKPRAVLAVLLLHANRSVSAERLALALYGEDAPAGVANTIQVHVSRLRKALPDPAALVTTPSGYELRAADVDAHAFERALTHARGAEPQEAAARLEEALALWRGPPLADLADEPFAPPEIARLEDLRAAALEELAEARLALGRHAEVASDLERLVAEHPYRERMRAQLMLALYRCDRQADALQAYQDARRALVDELGIEPGERLRALERAILAQDPALAAPQHAKPEAAPPRRPPARRLVSVVAARLEDAADPEAALARYTGVCAAAVERHGGTVTGFAGDAFVGVFDAQEELGLRAVRAALEIRAAAPGARVGVESGEAFVDDRLATGEAFTEAARLQRSATPGEILLGEHLRALLGAAVTTDGARLLDLTPEPPPASPFVGRDRELAVLREAADDTGGCRAITVIGPAGIGKSRLARELAATVDTKVVVARCPAYGDEAAQKPLAELVEQLRNGHELEPVVRSAAGLSDAPAQPGEAWPAFRRLFEAAAPLVAVVEDLHWAEPPLVELLEHLLALSAHPILLVCLARPELLEARPAWALPQPNRTLLELDPLDNQDAARLLGGNPDAPRIIEAAEGNPLFLEQLAAVDDGTAELPSSIQATLAARLDRLPAGEREILEEGSIEGRGFAARGADPALLVSLVGRRLIRPDGDGFRFAHALIREAAYRGIPKRRRADGHERLAREGAQGAHHLAEACRLRAELGEPDLALAAEAAARLEEVAEAAMTRGDPSTAARLLERAVALPGDHAELLPELGAALLEEGRAEEAARLLDQAPAASPRLRARIQVERELVRLELGDAPEPVDAEALTDDRDLARLWLLRGQVAWHAGRVEEADDAFARSVAREVIGWRALAAVLGPTPVPEAIERCEGFRAQARDSPLATASALNPLALLHAMRGDFATALDLVAEAGELLRDMAGITAGVSHLEAFVHLLAGRPERAEACLREDLGAFADGSSLATTTALLSRALIEQGREAEAVEMCRATERHAAAGDILTQAIWRGVLARATGDPAPAEAAVALLEPTDLLSARGDAMLDLALVTGSEAARRDAIALYERKGNVAAAARAHPEGGS